MFPSHEWLPRYRDNRLNMIHEGTAGIHAKTLLGRKVARGNAAPLFAAMRASADAADAEAAALEEASQAGSGGGAGPAAAGSGAWAAAVLREGASAVWRSCGVVERVTANLTASKAAHARGLDNAHEYLQLFGFTVVGWVWLRMATAAASGLARPNSGGGGEGDADYYTGKLQTSRFFWRHELPRGTAHAAAVLESLDATVPEMQPGWF